MSIIGKYGIKIKNIKAATLYYYNKGLRDRFDYTEGMFSNSLFNKFIVKNGLRTYKQQSTRDIICLDFSFGTRSYEEETEHLDFLIEKEKDENKIEYLGKLKQKAENNKDLYEKISKEKLRKKFYEHGVSITYKHKDKISGEIIKETINYMMLYRNSSKAKMGQVIFINKKLYKVAYDWLTMGIGNKMPAQNAKIVELSAYSPLVTSTIEGEIHIPVGDILILKDRDSLFFTDVDVVLAENYGENQKNSKKCVVNHKKMFVKNTIWDGMAVIEAKILPEWVNGMALLRNHFFKTCALKTNLQKFFRDWCKVNGFEYENYEVEDIFGVKHRLKDIKMVTTDNAIKWKKFIPLMGKSEISAYKYWCRKIKKDKCCFGIVKTDHISKLGSVQQMSYQMINTLPCTKDEIYEIAKRSIDYVELLKKDNNEFEKFLRKNANEVNHYEMMADLYRHNPDFAGSKWFKTEKARVISGYVCKLRKGKIFLNGDNLTMFGNPYALLLYSVGEDYQKDPTLHKEHGVIQCFTKRFKDGEYLCGFRSPHNSPNNTVYLHNVYSNEINKYFELSPNVIIVNCLETDIQCRLNGADFDSDFIYVTNMPLMVKAAKKCYETFPTVVNDIKESGISYDNTMGEYANMDNKFARGQRYIGESSNLAQLAMSYYWTDKSKELYDNFVILAVLAQIVIDSCKREYEIDYVQEIERIKSMSCMTKEVEVEIEGKTKKIKRDLPKFMLYTRDIHLVRNGYEFSLEKENILKNKLKQRINETIDCPMNYLEDALNEIRESPRSKIIDTKKFFIHMEGKANSRQISKIRQIVEEYDNYVKFNSFINSEQYLVLLDLTDNLVEEIKKVKIGNFKTINRIIETALGIGTKKGIQYKEATKHTRCILKTLYRCNKDKFLLNFIPQNTDY